ncbi:MAG: ATP-binding protein [Chlamydiota bacterium]|jgi:AAA+ ATPase superfamily predicted ATPase
MEKIINPFRPGAGHVPPYLAGRETESKKFAELLEQECIFKNFIIAGLRGIGKTVLLNNLKPIAVEKTWLWTCSDLSEASSLSEDVLAIRLLTDLASVTNSIEIDEMSYEKIGFTPSTEKVPVMLNYNMLKNIYDQTPGLISDKLKAVFELAWTYINKNGYQGVVFAYDEAQNLKNHKLKDQYPVALLLEVFQSIQRKGIRFLLTLTGLPTLFSKLVEARTYAERMFCNTELSPLNETETTEAIKRPFEQNNHFVPFSLNVLQEITKMTKGYPYFIQYICREVFDRWVQTSSKQESLEALSNISPDTADAIMRKLDKDFFSGRWSRTTDRQRELLGIIACLPNIKSEFTVQEIIEHQANKKLNKPFSSSHVNQMLGSFFDNGLIYKNRFGKYSFAIPLFKDFIFRQLEEEAASYSK